MNPKWEDLAKDWFSWVISMVVTPSALWLNWVSVGYCEGIQWLNCFPIFADFEIPRD
jgi:hypothetical protein